MICTRALIRHRITSRGSCSSAAWAAASEPAIAKSPKAVFHARPAQQQSGINLGHCPQPHKAEWSNLLPCQASRPIPLKTGGYMIYDERKSELHAHLL